MVYDFSLIKDEYWGWWVPEYKLIRINPLLKKKKNKELGDLTILHEWLHAYEDLLTGAKRGVPESLIDQWAEHYRKETDFAQDRRLIWNPLILFQKLYKVVLVDKVLFKTLFVDEVTTDGNNNF